MFMKRVYAVLSSSKERNSTLWKWSWICPCYESIINSYVLNAVWNLELKAEALSNMVKLGHCSHGISLPILDIHFFNIFVHNRSFLDILPNFNLNTTTHVFWTFISKNLVLPLIFLVPILH